MYLPTAFDRHHGFSLAIDRRLVESKPLKFNEQSKTFCIAKRSKGQCDQARRVVKLRKQVQENPLQD